MDIDEVKDCQVQEGEAGVEHEVCTFVHSSHLAEIDVGRNTARPLLEWLLEQKA